MDEPVRIDACGAPTFILADQLGRVYDKFTLSNDHSTLGQAAKSIKMVNESMSIQELTARAYARGLPATKVRSSYLKSSGWANSQWAKLVEQLGTHWKESEEMQEGITGEISCLWIEWTCS